MTVRSIALIPAKQVENAQTTQYTANNCTTYVDKFTVTNTTAANVVFSANIVTVAGAAGATNLIINQRSIAPREVYTCPELIGQVLQPGDFISTLAGTAAALTMRASGREIT
jgi:hypothetical protein